MPQPEGHGADEGACWNSDVGSCQNGGGAAIFWPCKPDPRSTRRRGSGRYVTEARHSPRYAAAGVADLGHPSMREPDLVLCEETKRQMATMAKKIDMLSLQVDTCLNGISGLQATMTSFPEQLHRRLCADDLTGRTERTAHTDTDRTSELPPGTQLGLLGQCRAVDVSEEPPLSWDATPATVAVALKEDSPPPPAKPEIGFKGFARRFSSGSLTGISPLRQRRSKPAEAIWKFLEEPESSAAARWFATLWVPFIFATVICSLLQSVKPPPLNGETAGILELSFDVIFVVEVLLRFCVAPSFVAFFLSAYNIVDVLAAIPLFGRIVVSFDAAPLPGTEPEGVEEQITLILVCLAPVLRLLKTLRRFQQFHLFLAVLSFTAEALKFLLLMLILIVLTFSSLIYLVEPKDNIETLPQAMWLTVVTMTTVGYGDVTPESNIGHGIVAVLLVISVFVMAMPIGIIGNAFTETWKDRDRILLNHRFQDRMVQCGYTAQDIAGMFTQFDSDKNGELSLSEFVAMVSDMQLGLQEQRAVLLFEQLDKDGSGGIDAREFVREFFPTRFNEIYGGRESKEEKKDERRDDDDRRNSSRSSKKRHNGSSRTSKSSKERSSREELSKERPPKDEELSSPRLAMQPDRPWETSFSPTSSWGRQAQSQVHHLNGHGEAGTGGVPPDSLAPT